MTGEYDISDIPERPAGTEGQTQTASDAPRPVMLSLLAVCARPQTDPESGTGTGLKIGGEVQSRGLSWPGGVPS